MSVHSIVHYYIAECEKFISMAKESRSYFLNRTCFTRDRKMGFENLVIFMLNLVKESTSLALERYFDKTNQEITMTQQSFSESRKKIKSEFFRDLFRVSVQTAYKGSCETWNGYRVSAIDGSTIALPSCPELLEYFGGCGRGAHSATGRTSLLYDVLNKVVMDAELTSLSIDERTLAKKHIETFARIEKREKEIVLFDRGYPAWQLIGALASKGIHFLMRVPRNFNPVIDRTTSQDSVFSIEREDATHTLRVIKFVLPCGEEETLLTDVLDEALTAKDFETLYFYRWPIETKYDELKNKLELENFSGRSVCTILQDFFTTMFMSNLTAAVWWEAKEEADKLREGKSNKFEYIPNMNHAIGVMRDRLVRVLISSDPETRSDQLLKIIRSVTRNVIPVRPDRSCPRNSSPRKSKFHHNRKSNL